MRNTRTNQGGSVLAFIVVGAALAIAVVGGVYLAQQRGKEAVKDTPETTQTENKPTTGTTPTPQPTTPGTTNGNTGSNGQTRTPSTTPTTGRQIPTTGHDSSKDAAPNVAANPGVNNSTNLPTTGPLDTTLQIIGAAILTIAVVAYVRSEAAHVPTASR